MDNSGIKPKISVIMSVYNGQLYLEESILSILTQSFKDFEFIIIDDASNDSTNEIIRKYAEQDSRIVWHRNEKNLRLPASLNIGLSMARAPLVARMDADDVSLPHRLKTQYDFLDNNPEIVVCGSYVSVYEYPEQVWEVPLNHVEICMKMIFECCIYHPTVMFRKDDILNCQGGYDASIIAAEDYDLWQRLAMLPRVRFSNLPESLLRYRTHPNVDRKKYRDLQRDFAEQIRRRFLSNLGVTPENDGYGCHEILVTSSRLGATSLHEVENWLDFLQESNIRNNLFPSNVFRAQLEERWLSLCIDRARVGEAVWAHYLRSRWSNKLWADRLRWGARLLKMKLDSILN